MKTQKFIGKNVKSNMLFQLQLDESLLIFVKLHLFILFILIYSNIHIQ